jgi:DNA invertase Pin-like site-specific DNA recombinase
MPPQTAIGIVRVSQVRGRADIVSPTEQRQRIEAACEREGLELVEVIEELDISGGTPLAKRKGLRRAVEAVEAGQIDVIIVAYFDRLVRSLRVQGELVERVERARGKLLAVDVGAVTNGSAAQWLTSTLLGMVAEHLRRSTAERTREAQAAAVARGVAPWKNTTPGFTRNEDKVFQPNEKAPVVAEAFHMRGEGKSVRECRDYLAKHGIKRTPAAVSRLFHDRAVLGELHFGELRNLNAHPSIVSREAFDRAGRASAPRGRIGKSELLLARLGVLRCGTCGSRMVAGTANEGTTPVYRCRNPDCDRKRVVSARIAEEVVTEAVQEALRDVVGRASAEANVRGAERKLHEDQARLDRAIVTLEDFMDEPAAVEKLRKLREARDASQEQVEKLGRNRNAITISAVEDWPRLTFSERRDLIEAVVERATVGSGRGHDRLTVKLVGE